LKLPAGAGKGNPATAGDPCFWPPCAPVGTAHSSPSLMPMTGHVACVKRFARPAE